MVMASSPTVWSEERADASGVRGNYERKDLIESLDLNSDDTILHLILDILEESECQRPFPRIQEPRELVVRVGDFYMYMLVIRVHHSSLKPTRLTHQKLKDISEDAAFLYAESSYSLMNLVPEVVPDVVQLPGDADRYWKNQDAVAAAVHDALRGFYNLGRYDVIAYFLPGIRIGSPSILERPAVVPREGDFTRMCS